MHTQIIATIARNIGALTGSQHADKSTAIADARYIGESCLAAVEYHRDVVFAENFVECAEKRLDSCRETLPDEVVSWAEECISSTRGFLFAAETGRRS